MQTVFADAKLGLDVGNGGDPNGCLVALKRSERL
jgi:hypothetical protein